MNYKRIEIDLSNAGNDQVFELDGSFKNFVIVQSDAPFRYKLNTSSADYLYSEELQGFQGDGIFRRFYITNESQAGKKAVLVVF